MNVTAINTPNHVALSQKKKNGKNKQQPKKLFAEYDKNFEKSHQRAIILGLTAVGASLISAVSWFILTRGK